MSIVQLLIWKRLLFGDDDNKKKTPVQREGIEREDPFVVTKLALLLVLITLAVFVYFHLSSIVGEHIVEFMLKTQELTIWR